MALARRWRTAISCWHSRRHCSITNFPLLVGMSRKSMIGNLLDRPVAERLAGSLACALIGLQHGARIIRVRRAGHHGCLAYRLDDHDGTDFISNRKTKTDNDQKYFGTDGVRGKVGEYRSLGFRHETGLGRRQVLSKKGTKKVLIGRIPVSPVTCWSRALEAGSPPPASKPY